MAQSFQEHEDWFYNYAREKMAKARGDASPLALKYEHTRHVVENAAHIAMEEAFDDKFAEICKLSALYHDISRFDQYLVYGTFKDRDSRNHGLWSVKILKKENRLGGEDKTTRIMTLAAVALHNRFRLPEILAPEMVLAARVTRDADKLDILRVMSLHLSRRPYNPTVVLSLPDDPAIHSQKVLASAFAKSAASYSDLRSVNDFRVLLGSWFFDLNLPGAKRKFVLDGHGRKLVEGLPDNAAYEEVRNFLLKSFDSFRNPPAR